VLQTGLPADAKEQYHVAELLAYHDQHFIESVYLAILGRKPSDAERARELAELRSGREGKVEIIERLAATQEEEKDEASPSSARRVRIEGLPSPATRRLSRIPVLGYLLRLGRSLWRLPVLIQHHQEFEIYALAQQQLIADYINRALPHLLAEQTNQAAAVSRLERAIESATSQTIIDLSQSRDVLDAVAIFSDALLDLSNNHANLQAQTGMQVQQIDAALADLTQAITAQQQITEAIKREQHTLANAQQEFLIQEQQAIVETQKVVLAELRKELHDLSRRQESIRAEFDAKVRRLQSLADTAAGRARPPESPGLR
jgi:hypothetical protein